MAQSSTRTTPRYRSLALTSSTTIPMSTLFPIPTKVSLLIVGGGGGGANRYNGNGAGGGGGAGGSVVEYKDVWVTSDLVITIGAGGAASTPGQSSSVVCSVPGPFSGIYTAPGGENGGRGPDQMSQSHLYQYPKVQISTGVYAPVNGTGIYTGSDGLDPRIVVTISPYNENQASPASLLAAIPRIRAASDRFSIANLRMSSPLFFATTDGSTPFPTNLAGAPGGLGFALYDYRMSGNPGRGVSGGSTGGAGNALGYGESAYTDTSFVTPGLNGGKLQDGFPVGTAHPYGSGGGGGATGSPAAGGLGSYGGGNGASSSSPATVGMVNTGGGGGGASTQYFAASGGSGLVVMTWSE